MSKFPPTHQNCGHLESNTIWFKGNNENQVFHTTFMISSSDIFVVDTDGYSSQTIYFPKCILAGRLPSTLRAEDTRNCYPSFPINDEYMTQFRPLGPGEFLLWLKQNKQVMQKNKNKNKHLSQGNGKMLIGMIMSLSHLLVNSVMAMFQNLFVSWDNNMFLDMFRWFFHYLHLKELPNDTTLVLQIGFSRSRCWNAV